MATSKLVFPDGKRIAIHLTTMVETWSPGKAPSYSVTTTATKPGLVDHGGIGWARFGPQTGVWRFLKALDHFKIPGTFCVNAMIAELYPEVIAKIVKAGYDIAGHGVWQDTHFPDMKPEEQLEIIRKTQEILEKAIGKRPEGWMTPVLAFTPETNDFLVQQGVYWSGDAKDSDFPSRVQTKSGPLISVPVSEFSDNRVLKGSPKDFYDVYKDTFDYLYKHEHTSVMGIVMHCHWGGRAPMMAMVYKLYEYFQTFEDVWFTTQGELAHWFAAQEKDLVSYSDRYF